MMENEEVPESPDELEVVLDVSRVQPPPRRRSSSSIINKYIDCFDDLQSSFSYFKLATVLVLLVMVVITMAFFWPSFPIYVTGEKCSSPKCLSTAAELVTNMDDSYNVCDNPWKWACGNWIKNAQNRLGDQPEDREDEILFNLYSNIPDALNKHMSEMDTYQGKIWGFYDSCMNFEFFPEPNEFSKYHPLTKVIMNFGTWKTLKARSSDSRSFIKKLTEVHLKYDASPFFKLSVGEHPIINDTIIQLKPTEIGMPSRFYTDAPENYPVVLAYKKFITFSVTMLGENYNNGQRIAELIFNMEKRIASVISPFQESIPPSDLLDVMSIADMKLVAEHIPLMELLQELSPHSPIKKIDHVIASLKYVRKISNIISTTDEQTLHDYMLWKIIERISPYVSGVYDIELKKFQSIFKKSGTYSKKVKCSSVLYDLLSLGISHVMQTYNDQYNSLITNRRRAAEEIFQSVKFVLVDEIKATSDNIRVNLIRRTDSLSFMAGLTGRFADENTINNYYKEYFIIPYNYLENVLNLLSFRGSKTLFMLNDSFNYTERISMYTTSSNGLLYNKFRKVLSVPHYLIELPYFDDAMPLPVKYGRLGTLFGRGIAYSFAQHRDELAYLSYLLMKYVFSRSKWIDNAQCFHKFSKKFIGKDLITSSQIQATHQNNMFNLIGYKFASLALQDTIANNNLEIYTPGLEKYGQEGVFLLSYIQDLCTVQNKSFNKKLMIYSQKLIPEVFLEFFPLQIEYVDKAWCKPNIEINDNNCN